MKDVKIIRSFLIIAIFSLSLISTGFAKSDNKKPKIQWSQNKVEISAERRESLSIDVQFESDGSLSNASLWVVPELQPFISVSSADFTTIEPAIPYSASINVSIPDGTEIGSNYDGTIHLRDGSRTIPQTLKVELLIIDDDDDGDGFTDNQGDCNDTDPAINPDAQEVCDGLDNNCNGQVDEIEPEIHISSPMEGSTINSSNTIVTGTIDACSQEVGIIVNGVHAEISGSEFVANDIFLEIGINTLTAVATDGNGNTATDTITVHTDEYQNLVNLSANITSGMPPLNVYFQIDTNISNPITTYQMDFDGDGTIDYTADNANDVSFTYDFEGLYYATSVVTDDQENQYSEQLVINIISTEELNTLLTNKRSEIIGLLKEKDIQGALSYFDKSSQAKYEEAFTLLIDQLPEISSVPEEFNLVSVIDNVATYESVVVDDDGVTRSYPSVFIKDEDGFWKISTF